MYITNQTLCTKQIISLNPTKNLSTVISLFTVMLILMAFGCEADEELPNDNNDSNIAGETQCDAAPMCGEGEEQVEVCDVEDPSCNELSVCGSTIYCQIPEDLMCSPVVATCLEHEEDSDVPCQDGEICREEVADCSVTYCRPIEGEAMLQCEPEHMQSTDPFEIEEATIEFDTLWLRTLHSGNCEMHTYGGCFSEFAESEPVQVQITIEHEANGDTCEISIGQEHPFSLATIKQAYQDAYGVDSGTIVLNIEGTESLEYSF